MGERLVLMLALILAAGAGWLLSPSTLAPSTQVIPSAAASTVQIPMRIVSCSPVADGWLPDLVPGSRILGSSRWFRDHHPLAFRIAATAAIASLDQVEAIMTLRPDLVIVSDTQGDPRRPARLRDAGLRVLDLGPSQGRITAGRQLLALGEAVGAQDRAGILARSLERRLTQAASDIPAAKRPRAVVAQIWGDALSLATTGSSQQDLLIAAGCQDAAATRWSGWPRISVEDLATLQPDLIVCAEGHGNRLRRLTGSERVIALGNPGWIVELPAAYLDDPGPLLAEAAERLRILVHGEPK